MSRVGKIARLSQCLREQLNRRIEDGEPGRKLVEWLNSCDAVQDTLAEHFGACPITEQNLSEWKQGGFKDWQHHQETRSLVRGLLAEAEELEDEIGQTPFTDRLTETVTLALARLLREAMMSGEKGPTQHRAVIEITRELDRWRKGDHQMKRLGREEETWEQQRTEKKKAERDFMEAEITGAKIRTRICGNMLRREYCDGLEAGTLDAERAASLRKLFAARAEWLRECGVKELPINGVASPKPPAKSK